MSVELKVGSCYNFTLYPASIIGGDFKSATVLSIMDPDSARSVGADIDALHAKVYSYLPAGSVDDADAYNYVKVKTASGTSIIGLPWIREDSIVKVENIAINVVISGSEVNTNDLIKVRTVLSQAGYTGLTITSTTN